MDKKDTKVDDMKVLIKTLRAVLPTVGVQTADNLERGLGSIDFGVAQTIHQKAQELGDKDRVRESDYDRRIKQYFTKAEIYDLLMEYEYAIYHYNKVIEIDPRYKVAYFKMAELYRKSMMRRNTKKDDYKSAVDCYKHIIDIASDDSERVTVYSKLVQLHTKYLDSYCKTEEKPDIYHDVISCYDTLIKLDNTDIEKHKQRKAVIQKIMSNDDISYAAKAVEYCRAKQYKDLDQYYTKLISDYGAQHAIVLSVKQAVALCCSGANVKWCYTTRESTELKSGLNEYYQGSNEDYQIKIIEYIDNQQYIEAYNMCDAIALMCDDNQALDLDTWRNTIRESAQAKNVQLPSETQEPQDNVMLSQGLTNQVLYVVGEDNDNDNDQPTEFDEEEEEAEYTYESVSDQEEEVEEERWKYDNDFEGGEESDTPLSGASSDPESTH